jgi:hypothetical protein
MSKAEKPKMCRATMRAFEQRGGYFPSKGCIAMSSQPFKIGDEVTFIDRPAPTPEHVINITWIDAAPIPHWQIETAWQNFPGAREQRRTVDAAELRAGFALNSTRAAFVNVTRWALTLCCETGGGTITEATLDRIVEGAWCAFDEMEGAQLDVPVRGG